MTKRRSKSKIGVNAPGAGVTGVPFLAFKVKGERSRGPPHNMSALGRRSFLVTSNMNFAVNAFVDRAVHCEQKG